jgi:Zn-dependent metalloprotease
VCSSDLAEIVRTFWKDVAGRNSLDDKGVDLRSVARYDKNYDNAFQTSHEGEPIMVYGSGKIFLPLCKSLDVAGHEMGHAIVGAVVGLIYFGSSGALNESFADVFGECIEQWHQGKKISEASWLMGEDIMSDELKAKGWRAIRTFKQGEKAYPSDPQPDNWKNRYVGLDDNGGVHINSKIANAAFYNFCVNGGFEYAFKEPFQVWYKALQYLGSRMAGFKALKKASIKACEELHPDKVPALQQAWQQVGL